MDDNTQTLEPPTYSELSSSEAWQKATPSARIDALQKWNNDVNDYGEKSHGWDAGQKQQVNQFASEKMNEEITREKAHAEMAGRTGEAQEKIQQEPSPTEVGITTAFAIPIGVGQRTAGMIGQITGAVGTTASAYGAKGIGKSLEGTASNLEQAAAAPPTRIAQEYPSIQKGIEFYPEEREKAAQAVLAKPINEAISYYWGDNNEVANTAKQYVSAGASFIASQVTPENALLMGMGGTSKVASKLIGGTFAGLAASQLPDQYYQWQSEKDPKKKALLAVNMVGQLLITGGFILHGAKGKTPIKNKLSIKQKNELRNSINEELQNSKNEALAKTTESAGAPHTAQAVRETTKGGEQNESNINVNQNIPGSVGGINAVQAQNEAVQVGARPEEANVQNPEAENQVGSERNAGQQVPAGVVTPEGVQPPSETQQSTGEPQNAIQKPSTETVGTQPVGNEGVGEKGSEGVGQEVQGKETPIPQETVRSKMISKALQARGVEKSVADKFSIHIDASVGDIPTEQVRDEAFKQFEQAGGKFHNAPYSEHEEAYTAQGLTPEETKEQVQNAKDHNEQLRQETIKNNQELSNKLPEKPNETSRPIAETPRTEGKTPQPVTTGEAGMAPIGEEGGAPQPSGETPPGGVESTAVRNTETGETITGQGIEKHQDIIDKNEQAAGSTPEHIFIDDKGNQLNRVDAAKAALDAGQIDQDTYDKVMARTGEEKGLHSEDLQAEGYKGGPGAMGPVEAAEQPRTYTGTKNAVVDAERAKRGELPLMKQASQALGEVWQAAMKAIDRNEQAGKELVDELNKKPRTITATEEAILLHHKIDISNDLSRETNDALDPNKSQQEQDEASVRAAGLLDRLNEIDQATKAAGTEWGRTGRFRQQLAADDYSLAKMLQQKQLANKGKALTPKQTAEVKKLNQRIQELEKQLADHEEKSGDRADQKKDKEADQNIKKIQKKAAKDSGKPYDAAANKKIITDQIKAKRNNPESVGSLIQKLAEHFVRTGIKERNALVSAVHGAVKDILPESTPRDIRDAISGYGKYKELSKDEVKVTLRDLKGQMQQVSKLEDMIKKGKLPAKTGIERRTPTAEERSLIKEVNNIRKELGLESDDPAKLKSALDTAKTRIKNRIEDLQRAIEKNEKIPPRAKSKLKDDELRQLRSDRDAKQKEYDAAFKDPKLTPEQIALKIYKTRTAKRIVDLNDKVSRGDFSKSPRKTITLDAEGQRLKADASRAKVEFQRALAKDRQSSRTKTEKFIDAFPKWSRAFLLSNPATLAKLTAAAAWRMGITPIKEVIGGGLSKVLPEIAKRAPREGYFNIEAESKSITDAFTKGMKDAWNTLTKGESELESAYGKQKVEPGSVLDFLAHIHGALKSVPKRAEFARSFQKRIAYEMRQGVDVTDPLVQTRIATESLRDANRSIFMQDNRVQNAFKGFIRILETPNKEGKIPLAARTGAAALKTLLPITKVPTNIVAEGIEHVVGTVTGSARLASAIRSGVENLKPEEADLILRELKSGILGNALIATGFLTAESIGGYYAGKKQKEGETKYGNIKLYGKEIPATLLHNPTVEMLQYGATIRHVADSKLRKKDQYTQGIPAGVLAASLGLVSETPLISEQLGLSKLFNANERPKFIAELAKSRLDPQLIQFIAQQMDKDKSGNVIQRKPSKFAEYLEEGIPVLRKNVPEKEEAEPETYRSEYMKELREEKEE
jgi:hypothetical protein